MNQIDQIKEDIRIYAQEGMDLKFVMASLYEQLEELRPYIELAEVTVELETMDFSSNALAGYGEPPAEEDYTNAARYTALEQRYYELINKIKEQGDG